MARKRPRTALVGALAGVLLVGGGVGWSLTDQGRDWWRDYTSDPGATTGPSTTPGAASTAGAPTATGSTPEAEDVSSALGGGAAPSPVAASIEPDTAPGADPAKVQAALARVVKNKGLGPRVVVQVANLSDGASVYASGPTRFLPASTTKILTSVAALEAMGPATTFQTRVVTTGRAGGAEKLVLVGGGDPFLASSPQASATVPHRGDLTTLAASTARALKERGVTTVRLDRDASLFSGPADNPKWQPDYVPDGVVTPISALWVDKGVAPSGWGRVADPAQEATTMFADLLRKQGLTVRPGSRQVSTEEADEQVASVQSAPLSEIVEHVMQVSDNEGAEVLSHHVGLQVLGQATFTGGIEGTRTMLEQLGVDLTGWEQFDGSGLSRHNLFRPQTLIDALRVASSPEHPELRAVVTGLPVAGFNGSLRTRFDETNDQAAGMVRAKTGTLTGAHSLAGLVTDRSGAVLVYVAAADRVAGEDTTAARLDLVKISTALARCSCGE